MAQTLVDTQVLSEATSPMESELELFNVCWSAVAGAASVMAAIVVLLAAFGTEIEAWLRVII